MILDQMVCNLFIPTPSHINLKNSLMAAGILRVRDICLRTETEIKQVKYAKGQCFEALKSVLDKHGLRFGMTQEQLEIYRDNYWANL